ncbi:MAG TPA: TMEM175 family protein [Gemmatimonadales bacterium]|nr:TMEM175 family protein [Gemmatimonadales bacterium]
MESRRIEALADGVFAVAMTLLVLQVHVPDVPAPLSIAAALEALQVILPTVGGYAVSFLILGTLWIGHHNQFRYLRRVDAASLWANLFFLLCVAFVPFTTAFVARYPTLQVPLLLYGATLLLAGLVLFAHWSHAVDAELVDETMTPELADSVRERISMGLAMYLAATIVGGFLPKVGMLIFACVPVVYMLPSRLDPRLVADAAGE